MIRVAFWFWLWTKPKSVRQLARKLPPWHEYLIKTTGQMAQIIAYCENETVTLYIFDGGYEVFGYGPADLERV